MQQFHHHHYHHQRFCNFFYKVTNIHPCQNGPMYHLSRIVFLLYWQKYSNPFLSCCLSWFFLFSFDLITFRCLSAPLCRYTLTILLTLSPLSDSFIQILVEYLHSLCPQTNFSLQTHLSHHHTCILILFIRFCQS